jgi:hypothetical protein
MVETKVLEERKNSLLYQTQCLRDAQENQNHANLMGAMAILSGEITADDHEVFDAQIEDSFKKSFGLSNSEYFLTTAQRIEEQSTQVDLMEQKLAKIKKFQDACQDTCMGPILPLRFIVAEKLSAIRSAYRFSKFGGLESMRESDNRYRAYLHDDRLRRYGKCGNKAIRKAFADRTA